MAEKKDYLKNASCSVCYGAEAVQMYKSLSKFKCTELEFESHFSVHIFECPECAQQWINAFLFAENLIA